MRLLVSVVDVNEAQEAVLGGADIIDVKNPAEGSLGAQPPRIVRAIREATPADLPVSAALGDLPHLPGTAALAALGAALLGIQYVKVALVAPGSVLRAQRLLEEVHRAVTGWSDGVRVVAVGFADGPLRGDLEPGEVVEAAAGAGVAGCMLDTLDKASGRSLLQILSATIVRQFVEQAHRYGMEAALAGSLRPTDVPRIAEIGADIVGMRGAACVGDRRSGRVARDRVAQIRRMIPAAPAASPTPSHG